MTTPTRAGWYDDPQDDAKLRYFDGVVWTNHTTPRSTRAASVAPQQGQQAYPGQGHPPQYPGQTGQPPQQSQEPYQQAPAQQAPTQQGGYQQPQYQQPPYQQPQYQQAPNPQFPGAPQQPGWNAPAYPGMYSQPTTPDGQPLASYWQRVGAFVIDWLIQAIVSGVLGSYFLVQAFDDYFHQMSSMMSDVEAGTQPDFQALANSVDARQLAYYSLIAIVVFIAYQYFFLTRSGQTPGKMVTGISVRLRDRPGVPSGSVVMRRLALPVVLFVLQLVPVLGVVGQLVRLLDLVWPAWDKSRQALHDKVAQTNVVVGKQPRRQR
jgi:uncharacterized RDD family membrane protein YckC